ncbi:MAG: hypothetical protein AMS24_02700 [Chlamydiae bacterium SM23_39]|nr:MAG: hypothetical protein AMS24_02700 [Chlamydiae bacterium SM23_39]
MIFTYLLEWLFSFIIIGIFYYFLIKIFKKKFNLITSVIFSFILIGIFSFLVAPYLITFSKPAWIYLPFLIFWFVFNLIKANREM